MTNVVDESQVTPYLSFKLNREIFALEVGQVIEIVEVPKITHIPQAPGFMRGVINIRGKVLPLIDACVKFNLPSSEFTLNTCIIVVEIDFNHEQIQFGILVDEVLEVFECSDRHLQSSPIIDVSYDLNFIRGILKVKEDFVIVMDINQAFSVKEIESTREAGSKVLSE